MNITSYDINGDGVAEIIVGRDDGKVDIYMYEEGEEQPTLLASHVCVL
jgi:hypothetical protein